MRLLFLILTGCLASAVPVHARLGETYRECGMRYQGIVPDGLNKSHPLVPGALHATFVFKGWRVRIAFVNNRAVAEEYRKELSHPDGFTITAAELASILEAEKGEGTWKQFKGDFTLDPSEAVHQFLINTTSQRWHRSDGATAETVINQSVLLQTPAALRATKEYNQKAAEAQKARIPKF